MSRKVKKQKTVEELLEEALVPEEEQPYEVPGNWVWVKFGSVLSIASGKSLTKKQMDEDGIIPVYGGNGVTGFHSEWNVDSPTIVIGRVGFYCGSVHKTPSKAWITDNAFIVKYNSGIFDEHFLHWMLSYYDLKKYSSSSAQPVISGRTLNPSPLVLPPLNEQKRIADKVESLLNKVDEAKRLIDEAKETFELRRAAILDMAFRGELTAKWREENQEIEPVSKLLESIKEDKDGQIKKKKATNDEVTDIPYRLPNGWSWIALGEIADMQNGLSKRSGKEGKSVPVLRLSDIQGHNFTLENPREILLTDKEYEKYKVENGDVLFIRVNGSYELVGKAVLYDLTKEAAYNDHLIKASLSDKINILYIWYLFESPIIRSQLATKIVSSAGQNTISQTSLSSLLIPIPPVEEMKEIVNKIGSLVNNDRDHLEKVTVDKVIVNLKQSILSKAFRGELGTNDPTEENAIELLKEVLQKQVK
jgi:type I restriction enzyme S subunit